MADEGEVKDDWVPAGAELGTSRRSRCETRRVLGSDVAVLEGRWGGRWLMAGD